MSPSQKDLKRGLKTLRVGLGLLSCDLGSGEKNRERIDLDSINPEAQSGVVVICAHVTIITCDHSFPFFDLFLFASDVFLCD